MRHYPAPSSLFLTGALLACASCNTAGFDAVSISPIYGWVDGCNTVRISGHGFAEDATASLGDLELAVSARGAGLDKGYWLESVLAAAPVTAKGYADVTVTSEGKGSKIADAYYFVECPQAGNLELLEPEVAGVGEQVTLTGCGLDAAALTVRLVPPAGVDLGAASLTSSCGTASAMFVVPELPAGVYDLQLIDAAGAVVFPPYACPITDTADTAAASLWCPSLTVGSAK